MNCSVRGRSSRLLAFVGLVSVTAGAGSAASQSPIGATDLDRIYRAGRAAFHRAVAARLASSPSRSALDSTELAWLADSTSGLFDRVIYLGWQRDRPSWDSLLRRGGRVEFDRRFQALSEDYAGRLVENLFRRAANFDLLMTIPGRQEARPLGLVRASLGWGAKAGDPGLGPNHHPTVDRAIFARQWWLPVINVAAAQRVTMGRGVRVAVLDTGVDPTLDWFQGRLEPGVDLVAHGGPPWIASSNDPVWDWAGHGTAVTSVLLTVAPEVTVVPIRTGDGSVSNDPPYPYWLDESIAAGIHAAVHRGVQIINLSAGIEGHPVLEQAVDAAIDRGVVVVAAAGRYARTQKEGDPFSPSFPAAYPQVVDAGSFGITGGIFTRWAPLHPSKTLDILTPGVDVVIASPSYPKPAPPTAATGSSLSAPIATAIVALMMAADSVTPPAIRRTARYARWIESLLQRTANPRLVGESGFTERTGFGVVDAEAAVAAARAGLPR
jgi:hypothetical protein